MAPSLGFATPSSSRRLSVWCNWFAWSPVLAIGSGLGAGYILSLFFAPDAAINTWQLTLLDLGAVKEGLTLRINATFFIGLILMLACFLIQHGGILRSARATMLMGVAALLPLMLIGIVPLLTGDLPRENFVPLVPLGHDAAGDPIDGAWDKAGWILFFGGLFIAAWSTYGFETAVCYTREFKDPKRDTFKAIFYSGLVCLAVFILVPLSFQGALGLTGMLAPDIYSGMGVGKAMAGMLGGGAVHRDSRRHPADLRADADHHDGDGRIVAHAVSGVGRWLAAALSLACQRAGRADAGDVDGSRPSI